MRCITQSRGKPKIYDCLAENSEKIIIVLLKILKSQLANVITVGNGWGACFFEKTCKAMDALLKSWDDEKIRFFQNSEKSPL